MNESTVGYEETLEYGCGSRRVYLTEELWLQLALMQRETWIPLRT